MLILKDEAWKTGRKCLQGLKFKIYIESVNIELFPFDLFWNIKFLMCSFCFNFLRCKLFVDLAQRSALRWLVIC